MNQDSNNLNQNFNEQNNNMSNNQTLQNNQSLNNINQSLNNNVYQNQNYQQVSNNNQNIVSNNNNMPSKNKTPIIISIIVLILIIGIGIFAGIKIMSLNNETNNQKISSNNSVNEKQDSNTNNDVNPSEDDKNINDKKINTAQVPGKKIFVDYDASFRRKEEAYTIVFYNTNDMLVGLSFKKDISFTGNLNEVTELFKTDFINDASLSSRGNLYGAEMEILTSENVKIAGFDSVKFTARVLNENTWYCHIYGYTFIIDGTPCAVIGIVSNKDQTNDMITSLEKNVDTIASTIRTEK